MNGHEDKICRVFDELGLTAGRISFLAQGSESRVWRAHGVRSDHVFRLSISRRNHVGVETDARLRAELARRGGKVARVLAHSGEFPELWPDHSWCIETFEKGTHPARGGLAPALCRDLGQTLATLHAIPVAGAGRPLRFGTGRCIGDETSPERAVAQRYDHALPHLWPGGFQHPILSAAPELTKVVTTHMARVREVVAQGNMVLCHTDLHEKQILTQDDRLRALLDFGHATLLDPHWDLGSVLYFHGPECFANIHVAYQEYSGQHSTCAKLTHSFAAAIALHHGMRSRLPGKGHRLAVATDFLRRLR